MNSEDFSLGFEDDAAEEQLISAARSKDLVKKEYNRPLIATLVISGVLAIGGAAYYISTSISEMNTASAQAEAEKEALRKKFRAEFTGIAAIASSTEKLASLMGFRDKLKNNHPEKFPQLEQDTDEEIERTTQLEATKAEARDEIAAAAKAKADAEAEAAEQKRRADAALASNASLQKELTSAQSALENAQSAAEAAAERAKTLEADKNASEEDRAAAQAEADRLKKLADEKQLALETAQASLEELKKVNKAIQDQIARIKKASEGGVSREELMKNLSEYLCNIKSFKYLTDEMRDMIIEHYTPGGAAQCNLDDGPFAAGCGNLDGFNQAQRNNSKNFFSAGSGNFKQAVLVVEKSEFVVLDHLHEAIEALWADYAKTVFEYSEKQSKVYGLQKSKGAIQWAKQTKKLNEERIAAAKKSSK